jgi:predicted anti-sigma-YlaC factor YlaD
MIMKCNEIREMLPDLAAGFTAPGSEVNDHLRSCADCAGTLSEFRKTMALLDEWQAPEPSPYFDTRLLARLREEAAKQPVSWLAWLRRPAIAVSMAVALVAGTTLFIEHRGGGNTAVAVAGPVTPGTAVSDLQVLDVNHDVLSDSDPDSAASLLDDLQVQNDVNANP